MPYEPCPRSRKHQRNLSIAAKPTRRLVPLAKTRDQAFTISASNKKNPTYLKLWLLTGATASSRADRHDQSEYEIDSESRKSQSRTADDRSKQWR